MALVEQQENIPLSVKTEDSSEENESGVDVILSDSLLNRDHPLKNIWQFWFLNSQKDQDWMLRLSAIAKLSTVEEFWGLVDRIRPPNSMMMCDYSLFRDDIQPVWEVPENKDGGRLVFGLQKGDHDSLNELWLSLMMGLIGNHFGEATNHISGAVCSIRQKGSKISIWTANASDEATINAIGKSLRTLWQKGFGHLLTSKSIYYESHADSRHKQSSTSTHKYYL